MIDIANAKKAFQEYVKAYHIENQKIALKIAHTNRVSQWSRKIASYLKLEKEEIRLAELIGLLHDIGRFEQVKQYHTFVDKESVNHAELGVKILFEEGNIRNFVKDSQYDTIIKTAILNHNKPRIEQGLSNREELHSKIIRDADKTDILYVLGIAPVQDAYCCQTMYYDKIKPEIMQQFEQEHQIHYSDIENGAERMIAHFAYIFDFNYPFGLQVIEDNHYLDILANKYEFETKQTKQNIQQALQIAKEYMKQKLQ